MSEELTVEHIPSLVVAKDINGLYVPIGNADKHNEYYCPVCNNIVKPRALSSKKEQPHYYHANDECSKESQLHWLYKNWLFDKGTKFLVNDKEYVIDTCEVEVVIKTQYGDYNPDLVITTEDNCKFYVEINYSNKKDNSYADKWSDINAEVIEVDVKNLINSELVNNSLPSFDLIFTNGEYTGNYVKHKRKDRYSLFKETVGYKEKANDTEKYDWLWKEIISDDNTNLQLCLDNIDYNDAVKITRLLKDLKCIDKYSYLLDYCKNRFITNLDNMFPLANITVTRITARTTSVIINLNLENDNYDSLKFSAKSDKNDGLLYELDNDYFYNNHNSFMDSYKKLEKYYQAYTELSKLELEDCSYGFYRKTNSLHFIIYSPYKDKTIEVFDGVLNIKNVNHIKENLDKLDRMAELRYNNNKTILDCLEDFDENVDYYNRLIKQWGDWFYIKREFNTYIIKTFKRYEYDANDIQDVLSFKTMLANVTDGDIEGYNERVDIINVGEEINRCKNKHWHLSCNEDKYILYLFDDNGKYMNSSVVNLPLDTDIKELKKILLAEMKQLILASNNSYTRIFLED